MTKDISDIDKQIGLNIKTIRKATGLTQGNLGQQIGISAQQINKYETGVDRVSASTLYKIANVFHCNMDILLPQCAQNIVKVQSPYILKVAEEGAIYQTNNTPANSNALELLKLFFKMAKEEQSALITQLKNKTKNGK